MIELTKNQARRFILCKQGLLGKYRFIGKQGAYEYIRQAGCIQYDPVDVCGKNAELTLQSRVKGFRKTMLEELLYRDRLLVDYADKELSIWPAGDWPYFSSYRQRSRKHGERFEGLAELEKQALSYIEENGPVCSDTLLFTERFSGIPLCTGAETGIQNRRRHVLFLNSFIPTERLSFIIKTVPASTTTSQSGISTLHCLMKSVL